MNKKSVVQVPKDTILDGVIIDVEKTTWAKIISPEKICKFDEPDQEIILIKFETKYNDSNLKGEDTFKFYENPMANSKLGKFLEKYTDLKVGQSIKVDYNKDGFPSIRIE